MYLATYSYSVSCKEINKTKHAVASVSSSSCNLGAAPSCPPVTLATALESFRGDFKVYPFLLSSNQFVLACHIIIRYRPLGSSPSLSSLPPGSLFSSSQSWSPSNLSSSSPHALSLLFLLSSCSWSGALGFLCACVVAKKLSTTGVAFLDPNSCFTVSGYRPTCISCSCCDMVCSFCNAAHLNMMWRTSICYQESQSQHWLLSLFPVRVRKVPVTVCPDFS